MSMFSLSLRRVSVATAVALGATSLFVVADGSKAPAQAQGSVSIEFRGALEPYGQWRQHPRFGEVWVPANRPRNWRPYTRGHWVYTDDWGWYWISDDDEADWGLVTYHYGRWVFDRGTGWVWIRGNEWAPAWVDWRRGRDHVGWAPLPPDEVIVEVREDPVFWTFVRPRDLVAPRIIIVILPPAQQTVYIRETVVVNRTVIIEDRGPRIAVNPGIPPTIIAAATGRPLPTFEVKPRVLAGTQGVQGSVEVRPQDLRGRGAGPRGADRTQPRTEIVQRTSTVVQPAASVPPPQPLQANEKGRLGERPPRAAQGATQPAAPSGQPQATPGATPEQRRQTAPAAPAAPATPAPTAPAATPQPGTPGTPAAPGAPPARQQPGAATPGTQQPPASRPGEREQRRDERQQGRQPRTTPPTGQQPATQPSVPSREQRPQQREERREQGGPRPETPRAEPPRAPAPPPAAREAPPPSRPAPAPAPAARPAPPAAQAAPPAAGPRQPAPAGRPAPAQKPPAEEKKDDKKE